MSCTCFLGHPPCCYCESLSECEGCGESFSRKSREDVLCGNCSETLEDFKSKLQTAVLATLNQQDRIPHTDAGAKIFIDSAIEMYEKLYPTPAYEIEVLPLTAEDRRLRKVNILIKEKPTMTISFNVGGPVNGDGNV